MKSYLVLSSVLAASAIVLSLPAQAQTAAMSNAEAEIYGPSVPPNVAKPAPTSVGRAAVTAELARARSAGEMDFAYAELNGTLPQRGSVTAGEMRIARRDAK